MQVCVESKNLNMAFSLFSEMKRHRIKPNLVSMNHEGLEASYYFILDSLQFDIQRCYCWRSLAGPMFIHVFLMHRWVLQPLEGSCWLVEFVNAIHAVNMLWWVKYVYIRWHITLFWEPVVNMVLYKKFSNAWLYTKTCGEQGEF